MPKRNKHKPDLPNLQLLPYRQYKDANHRCDPLRFYYWPVLGKLYCRRVQFCLAECTGGQRVLEVGYGSGITFLNLHDLYQEIHGVELEDGSDEIAAIFRMRRLDVQLHRGSVFNLPYPENYFDTVLLISILEHLKPAEQDSAFAEIRRVLRPGGQVVYGVPVERPLMVFMFRLLGYNIREHHFSTQLDVSAAAGRFLTRKRLVQMRAFSGLLGPVYEVGHYLKEEARAA